MKPLAKTVATMEPIVAGYAVTRWKIAGAFALGTTLITILGWVVSLFAGKIIAWVFTVPLKTSFKRASPSRNFNAKCYAAMLRHGSVCRSVHTRYCTGTLRDRFQWPDAMKS